MRERVEKLVNKVKTFLCEHPTVVAGIAAFFGLWNQIRFWLW